MSFEKKEHLHEPVNVPAVHLLNFITFHMRQPIIFWQKNCWPINCSWKLLNRLGWRETKTVWSQVTFMSFRDLILHLLGMVLMDYETDTFL